MKNTATFHPIRVELHQEREYKSFKVRYENASVTRIAEYVDEKGKERTHRLEVTVRAKTDSFGDLQPVSYEVNWSAIGSVEPEWATAYAEMLTKAVEIAGKLTAAYVK